MGPPHEGSIRRPTAPWANALPLSYVPLLSLQRMNRKEWCPTVSAARPMYQRPWYVLLCLWDGVKAPLLLIGKSSPCSGGRGFPLLLYECPLSYFSFQPLMHDWCNKDRGICYHVCGMVHIKESLLLIGKIPDRGPGVRYNSLLWMCTLNSLTWPDLTWPNR